MWRQFYFKDNLKDKNICSYSCFAVNYECKFSNYGMYQSLFMFQNAPKILIRDMCENGKP